MSRTNEIKSIMRQLKESKKSDKKYEAVSRATNEEDSIENDASEADLIIARLEDILSRFEKVIAAADEEVPEEETEETEEVEEVEETPEGEEKEAEETEETEETEEEAAEESYTRSLEQRIADLERRYTESRRRNLVKSFKR